MNRCIWAALWIGTVLVPCIGPCIADAQAQGQTFLPLEVGNSWTYVQVLDPPDSAPDTLARGTFAISERISINDTTYYVAPHPFALSDTLRSDDEGRIWARLAGREALLFDFALADGERYSFSSSGPADREFEVSIQRGRTVDVIAGTYEDAVTLRFDVPQSIDDERSFTFAPGVGIVEASGPVGDYVELHTADVYPRVDTLEWRGYFPLAVGNAWQYEFETWSGTFGTLGEWIEHWEVTGDSLLDAETYFVMEVRCDTTTNSYPELFTHSCDPSALERRFIRYEENAANMLERRVVDGTAEEDYLFDYDFRLDAPLPSEGESAGGMAAGYSYYPADRPFSIDGQELNAPQKIISIYTAVPGGIVFAHGIGVVSLGFSEFGGTRHDLTYARVGGVSYGTFRPVTVDPPLGRTVGFSLETYPNPADDNVHIEYSLSRSGDVRLLLHDVLGRQVRAKGVGHGLSGRHGMSLQTSGLSSGTYMMALELGGDIVSRTSIVIVR